MLNAQQLMTLNALNNGNINGIPLPPLLQAIPLVNNMNIHNMNMTLPANLMAVPGVNINNISSKYSKSPSTGSSLVVRLLESQSNMYYIPSDHIRVYFHIYL